MVKKMIKLFITTILIIALVVVGTVPAGAARPGTKFLSEIHMAQADDAETAKKMLTDNGYTVFDKNLNPGGDEVVYLGYKTSADVEDAITDISVMNMNGGYSISNYEEMLEDSFNEYKEMISFFRIAATEFAQNYQANSKEAMLAYRQLNYYYVEKDGVKTYMGDYMLNFPTDDADFADILMKGNVSILSNIRALLAMGVGEPGVKLADKVALLSKDETVYDSLEYYDDAKTLYNTLMSVDKDIEEVIQNIADIEADTTLTDDEKAEAIEELKLSASQYIAFRSLVNSLPYGDTTYGEYLESVNQVVTDYSIFYPIIAAFTPGQRALIPFGQIIPLVMYDAVEKNIDELEAELAEVESKFDELDVYFGTDLSIYEGSYAVTDDAMRQEAATGESWTKEMMSEAKASAIAEALFLGAGSVVVIGVSMYIFTETLAATLEYPELIFQYTTLANKIDDLFRSVDYVSTYLTNTKGLELMNQAAQAKIATKVELLNSLIPEYTKVQTQLNTDIMQLASHSTATLVLSAFTIAIGAVALALSISKVIKVANSYKIEYTDIPVSMVDCVNTENGDRYIRYNVVNSFYEDGSKTKTRPGDTNAYDGDQWNAIYYTKNYEAGKCMLASADWPTSEADFGKYAPVHKFGAEVCYNLTTHTGGDKDTKIFLSFQTSNSQKAAAENVPTVVGSAFSYGFMGVSGAVGLGLGMGIMGLIKGKKKEK